jgi:hypothetical protein
MSSTEYTPPEFPIAPSSAPRRVNYKIVIFVILILAAAWFTYSHLHSPKIQVSGTLTLRTWSQSVADDGICIGTGGYSDLAGGSSVVIADDSGHTLKITHLESGKHDDSAVTCTFRFHASVAAGKHFYGVTVTHRGTIKLTENEMSYPSLSIGD